MGKLMTEILTSFENLLFFFWGGGVVMLGIDWYIINPEGKAYALLLSFFYSAVTDKGESYF